MTRLDASKPGAIHGATLTLLLGFVVAGCADRGESSPKPGSVDGISTATPADAGKAPIVPGKKTAKVKPARQVPGEADYEDKPGARGHGR